MSRAYASFYASVLAGSGVSPEQRERLDGAARAAGGRRRPFRFQRNAEVHAAVGDRDAAFEAITLAVDANLLDFWMDCCPLLDGLRSDARWTSLHETVSARAAAVVACLGERGRPMQKGKYELGRRLGGGGMAEVFLGSTVGAEGFSRKVAIKRVLPGLLG